MLPWLDSAGQLSPVEHAASYWAASRAKRGATCLWCFWLWAIKLHNISNQAEETEKGQQPSNDASLPKYSHRYNEGCRAGLMCLIKWTNIVSRGKQTRRNNNKLPGLPCAIGGIVLPDYRAWRVKRKRAGCTGSQRQLMPKEQNNPWKTIILHHKRAGWKHGNSLPTCWWGACAGSQVLSATVWGCLPIMEKITQLTF